MAPAQGSCAAVRVTVRLAAVQGAGVSRLPYSRGACAGASCRTGKFMCLFRTSTQSTPSLSSRSIRYASYPALAHASRKSAHVVGVLSLGLLL
eukprot:6251103-Pyramimonas_sp.AAC.1